MQHQVLRGNTALVVGASSGIGAACAQLLAGDGAALLIMGRREELLAKARAKLVAQAPGARVEIFAGDACQEGAVKCALARAHAIAGRLDIIVSTVGGGTIKPLLMEDAAAFRDAYQLNVVTAFLLVRYGVPLMDAGGAIAFLSTVAVVQSTPGLSAYVAAKAGLERFVRAAAHELGSAKIRINAVRPGLTRSAATAGMYEEPGLVDRFASETVLGRTGEPEDIARAVRFLVGPESAWITGQSISADGGQYLGKAPNRLDELYGTDVMDKIRIGRPPQ